MNAALKYIGAIALWFSAAFTISAQTLEWPTYKQIGKVKPKFEPPKKFLAEHPNFLYSGKYYIENISQDKNGEYLSDTIASHKTHQAYLSKNNASITLPYRFISYYITAPFDSKEYHKNSGDDGVYMNSDKYHVGMKTRTQETFPEFKNGINSYFNKNGIENYFISEKAERSFCVNNDLTTNDILLEFRLYLQMLSKEKEIPTYLLYELAVKDITGKKIATYGQICFMNWIGYSYKSKETVDASLETATHSLLNQYFNDTRAIAETKRIQGKRLLTSQDDPNFIKLINLNYKLDNINEEKVAVANRIKQTNSSLLSMGTAGLDMSKIDITARTVDASFNVAFNSVAAGAAVIGTSIAAGIKDAQIRKLRSEGRELQAEYDELGRKANQLANEIDEIKEQKSQFSSPKTNYKIESTQEATNSTDFFSEGNSASTNNANTFNPPKNQSYERTNSQATYQPSKASANAEDFFSEGVSKTQPAKQQAYTPPSAQSYAKPKQTAIAANNDFWEEGSIKPTPTKPTVAAKQTPKANTTSASKPVQNNSFWEEGSSKPSNSGGLDETPFSSVTCPEFTSTTNSYSNRLYKSTSAQNTCIILKEYLVYLIDFRLDDCFESAYSADVSAWNTIKQEIEDRMKANKCKK